MKKILGVFLLFLIIITACEKTNDNCKYMNMGVEGIITEVTIQNEVITNILVRGETKEEDDIYLYDYASVRISDDVKVYKDNKKVNINELKEGMEVRVILQDAVAESYPVQAGACEIYIR